MSSCQQCRHGRPPPAPDPDRRFTPSPQESFNEYAEIQSIQRQAAALNARVAALTTSNRTPRHNVPHHHQSYRPTIVSRTPPTSTNYPKKRDPTKERSKHRFYAVRNGIEGNEVYSSWDEAAPYCYDPKTEYFSKGTVCKGFPNYHQAWDWILGIKHTEVPIPEAPPTYSYPDYPPEDEDYLVDSIHGTDTEPPKISESEYLQEENTLVSDDRSEATEYDYNTFFNPGKSVQKFPAQIPTSTLTTTSDAYIEDLDNPTPFLKLGGDKALPKYAGRANEDINAFFYKLRIFLRHPSIVNCHLQESTNEENSSQSKYLCTLLGLYL